MTTQPYAISLNQMRRYRLLRSGLITPFATPEAAASALAGVQAQILPAAGLALWNRTAGFTHARYEELLFTDHTLVKLWGQRNTLHLYPSAEWPLVYAALAANQTWWGRTAEREDRLDDHDALVEQAAALLHERKIIGRNDLRAAGLDLNDDHLSPWGGIFADLVRRGYACHAGRAENEGMFAAREYWLPDLVWNPPTPESANLTLLRRFVHTYGPVTVHDFMYWRGGYAEPARRWWGALESELVAVDVAGVERFVLPDDLDDLAHPAHDLGATVHMLYRFEPLLLGHKEKGWIVAPEYHKRVFRIAGHIEGIVLDGGVAVATWRYDRKSRGLIIAVEPFAPLPDHVTAAIAAQAGEVAAFFDAPLLDISYR
ncbi:MAG: AlkZ family DNA glycosylase [Caldilineaceae bacterium]|nr:AlkZ family DNA glycosylase [Caldilineaceae bacterium]